MEEQQQSQTPTKPTVSECLDSIRKKYEAAGVECAERAGDVEHLQDVIACNPRAARMVRELLIGCKHDVQ